MKPKQKGHTEDCMIWDYVTVWGPITWPCSCGRAKMIPLLSALLISVLPTPEFCASYCQGYRAAGCEGRL